MKLILDVTQEYVISTLKANTWACMYPLPPHPFQFDEMWMTNDSSLHLFEHISLIIVGFF